MWPIHKELQPIALMLRKKTVFSVQEICLVAFFGVEYIGKEIIFIIQNSE
jgi:hypothetical protein